MKQDRKSVILDIRITTALLDDFQFYGRACATVLFLSVYNMYCG